MTNPKFNSLERRALAAFARHGGWLSPSRWAALAQSWPIRASHSHLLRLHDQELLERKRDSRGLLAYRLSQRGADRLAWLTSSREGLS